MQISMFDGDKPFKVNKPLRLITLFSGYDSQALALKYLGVPFEHYRTCEWAIPSIQALKDLHFEDDDIAKIGKNLSRSAQYHMFGDSIVTSCLMAIFGKMFNVDYESKIKELTKNLTGEG